MAISAKTAPPISRRVAIVAELDMAFARESVRGIRDQVIRQGYGQVCLFRASPDNLGAIAAFRPTGIVLVPNPLFSRRLLARWNCPIVSIMGKPPAVTLDDRACGQRQAQYYLERNFRNFAYVTIAGISCAIRREAGFRKAIADAGFSCKTLFLKGREYAQTYAFKIPDQTRKALTKLAHPTAIAAVDDMAALEFIRLCGEAGVRIPEDAAVLGMDNDELYCELASPSLSSLSVPYRRMGQEAAALLARLAEGKADPKEIVAIKPGSVILRQSTNVMAIHDARIQEVLETIGANPQKVMTLGDMANAAGISPRTLNNGFRRATGRSPMREVRRIRLDQAISLLVGTSLNVKEIARRCGWSNARSLARAVRMQVGQNPLVFRRHSRAG